MFRNKKIVGLSVLTAITAFIAIGTTSLSATEPYIIKGRCHMGGCGFTQVLSTKEVRSGDVGSLLEVQQRDEYVEAPIVNDEPQWDKIRVPKFKGPIFKSWVLCSTEKPAVIFPNSENGGFYVDIISPGSTESIYGVNTSSHLYYWGICHNRLIDEERLYDDLFNREAVALGYHRLSEDKEGQFQFRTMKQVLNFLGM